MLFLRCILSVRYEELTPYLKSLLPSCEWKALWVHYALKIFAPQRIFVVNLCWYNTTNHFALKSLMMVNATKAAWITLQQLKDNNAA